MKKFLGLIAATALMFSTAPIAFAQEQEKSETPVVQASERTETSDATSAVSEELTPEQKDGELTAEEPSFRKGLNKVLDGIDGVVWGIPTIILILLTGLLMTIRTKGIQFTKLGRGFKNIFKKSDAGDGEVSSFGALMTALSATIGTGNIVGVATAIVGGGPGALLWMWVAALLGIATKYAESMLAVKYREVKPDGTILGGPFYTIEKGLGPKFKFLAVIFAVCGVLAGLLGIGTMTQINGITNAVNNAVYSSPEEAKALFTIFGKEITTATFVAGLLVTGFAALVIIGGIRRISKVAEKIVPAMAFIYVFLGLSVILMNLTKVPQAFALIFKSAFGFKAVAAGATGYVIKTVVDSMQKGIARGIFSNEAGLGSAPIAAASAKVNEPVQQGMVSMLGTFIDTIIICTMTGLSVVIAFYPQLTGPSPDTWNAGLEGAALTSAAFTANLGGDGSSIKYLLMICLVFFAFTTILGWDYYSERCIDYLTKGNKVVIYIFRALYIVAVFIGPYMTVTEVWTIADITNGLMAIPNCISLIALNNVVASTTKDFFQRFPKYGDNK